MIGINTLMLINSENVDNLQPEKAMQAQDTFRKAGGGRKHGKKCYNNSRNFL